MNILVDDAIPAAARCFSPFGHVRSVPGHLIGRTEAAWADALVVRSVTRIDRRLLEDTDVMFVGSATAGVDHVDQDWLRQAGIKFAAASGANAAAVCDYVLAALGVAVERGVTGNWPDTAVGIIGYGNVGSKLARRLEQLGCHVLVNDPPRAARGTMDRASTPLSDLLGRAQVLSLHTPLVGRGTWSTTGLIDARRLADLPARAVLIQTSRGGILDDQAAARLRRQGDLSFMAMDVWEHEPVPDVVVMDSADLVTPHIAGYTASAKRQSVTAIVKALEVFLGRSPGEWDSPPEKVSVLPSPPPWPGPGPAFSWLTQQLYDIREDDRWMRRAMTATDSAAGKGDVFHGLRKRYGTRPGFDAYRLETSDARWRALFDAITRP